jgi:peptidoglycan/xylan/chitin deacetylase (PgdA/CDA1 family)
VATPIQLANPPEVQPAGDRCAPRPLWARIALPAGLLVCWVAVAGVAAWPGGWPILGALLFALGGLVIAATAHPPLQVFTAIPSLATGGSSVALTFDDGPDPQHTPAVLDALEAGGARGTFFLVGERVRRHPELAAAIAERGHQVASHGDRHDWRVMFTRRQSLADLGDGLAAVLDATGRRPAWYRPPIGLATPELIDAARAHGAQVAGWSVRPRDGTEDDPAVVRSRIAERIGPGDVVLLHDVARLDGRPPPAAAALPGILQDLDEQGLRAVTIAELFGAPAYQEGAPGPASRSPWPVLVGLTMIVGLGLMGWAALG